MPVNPVGPPPAGLPDGFWEWVGTGMPAGPPWPAPQMCPTFASPDWPYSHDPRPRSPVVPTSTDIKWRIARL